MATWIKLDKGDSFMAEVVAAVGTNTSLSWPGITEVAHAWLDFESGSWVAVYIDGDMNEALENGSDVRTTAYLATSANLLSFDRRLRASFKNDHSAWQTKALKLPDALANVSTAVKQAFRIP
jgi:hypothetical protein